ncbi:MAG: hypothetical protein EXR66_01235 [Dehalococcoidia bacterium]|nr:hypothetical protein [Dehalococcoidia bacterium]
MTAWIGIIAALAIGLGAAVQTAMLGSLGRGRGPTEAAWVSLLGSVVGISAIMLIRHFRGDPPALPSPLDRTWAVATVFLGAGLVLAISMRGLGPHYALTGLFGVAFLATAAALVPRLGVALFFGATTAGSVIGALAVDQFGAFGAVPNPVSLARASGLALILVGVVVARTVR